MHEMGIVFGLMDTLRKVMKENDVKSLKSVTILVGEASMGVPSYMLDCWDAARYDTEFKNTVLKIENVDAEGKCNNCGQIFKIKDNDRKCPNCGTYNEFVPVSGMDLEIKEVEVPEE